MLALAVRDGAVAGLSERLLADAPGMGVAALAARSRLAGAGEVLTVPRPAGELGAVLLVGVGRGSPDELRRAAAAATRAARRERSGPLALASDLAAPPSDDRGAVAAAEGHLLAAFRPGQPDGSADRVVLLDAPAGAAAYAQGVASAVLTARALINVPSLVKSPAWLAERALELAGDAGLRADVIDEGGLADGGFGGLLGVGAGSPRAPRLVRIDYRPPGARRHVALVGKGITFDSGGLSLKRGAAMELMKTDMAGAGAVLATMLALPGLNVPHRVTGLLALAENMPSGQALRPGDVLRHYGGRTVEVLNTDAEGRLVLADALAFAAARLRPDALIDVATLTGAIRIALGTRIAGLFASDDRLAGQLAEAGKAAGEPVWRLPLAGGYREALDSSVADLVNVAGELDGAPVGGGAIAAALFLQEFTAGIPWAHLDIAGTGRAEAERDEFTRGGTGFGVRLLLRWLTGF